MWLVRLVTGWDWWGMRGEAGDGVGLVGNEG